MMQLNFENDNVFDSLAHSNEGEEKPIVANLLNENNKQIKNNKVQINFVEVNPNEKRKTNIKPKVEENSIDKSA